ncbi:MAG TPA: sulfatase [Vicinamibacteria bacterium]|nr:sulfatase [Vicinamibacteria bacterium]
MKRRGRRAVAAWLGAALAASAACTRADLERPDLVLIVVDALRRDHLPFHGYPRNTAPFLTELAARGVVFERAHSTSSSTPPAVASLLTSLFPAEHGVVHGFSPSLRKDKPGRPRAHVTPLPDEAVTLAEVLGAAGYATFAVTQNPNVGAALGFTQGFASFDHYPKSIEAERIVARLEELKPVLQSRRPYFLYLHFMDVHAPYRARAPFFDESLADEGARRISAYDSGIHSLDARLRALFGRFGWDRDAFVVLTADHGEELGERGRAGHAATLFAEVLDIPLVMRPPGGLSVGRRHAVPVSLVDILPTLRQAAGLPPSSSDSGRSLLPFVEGRQVPWPPRPLFASLSPPDQEGLRATLLDGWKWVGTPEGDLLFDLSRDREEQQNRAADDPERLARLRALHETFESGARRFQVDARTLALGEDDVENLRALGYVR